MLNDKYIEELPDQFKQSYLDYKQGIYEIEPWGSHQPVLIHTLNTITEGNVLEIGMGFCSTPLIHLICQKQNRNILSLDYEQEFFKKLSSYENDKHKMFVFTINKLLNKEYDFFKERFSIVFVDASPGWIRQKFIELIKDNADYIIVHDTEAIKEYSYDFSMFKYVLPFTKVKKQTSILSNLDTINKNLLQIF